MCAPVNRAKVSLSKRDGTCGARPPNLTPNQPAPGARKLGAIG